MASIGEFFDSYFLWRDAVIVGAVTGAICGFLGVYVVLRRIIFVSAALTQISSFGVALAFYLQGLSSFGLIVSIFDPFVLSLILTSLAALLFALTRDFFPISQEGVIGFAFLIAAGAVVIIGDRITKGAHEIADILFGSAVVVDPKDVVIIPIVALIAIIIHWIFFKDFIFVSFDPDSARLFRYPVRFLNTTLLVTLAIVVAVSTRALGALPVFGLLALPPLASLFLTENISRLFILSVIIGVFSAVFGYFISFIFSFPTGASIAVVASLFFIFAIIFKKLRKIL